MNGDICVLIWCGVVILPWLVLLLAWGRFWRADQVLPAVPAPADWPDVQVVIPARNEAPTIARVVTAHRATAYPGRVRLLVVDDNSQDGTGDLARAAGAEVLSGEPLPPGWSGKLWALHQGLEHAGRDGGAEWTLLTDADILHDQDALTRLVTFARAQRLAMVSLMARLDVSGIWGALLIPGFIFFFQKLYPFPWVNRPGHWCAAAAGGCILVRTEALQAIGGIAAMRGALIDDCTLAARIKRAGHPIWLGLSTGEVTSLRDNSSFGSVWSMVKRTAFTQLRHSWWLLAGTTLGMVWIYLGWLILVLVGIASESALAILAGLGTFTLMSTAYLPTIRAYGLAAWRAGSLPVVAVLYGAMTVASALDHARGRGGAWKGRTYPD